MREFKSIEKITAQEFGEKTNSFKRTATVVQEELHILMDLHDGEAIKFPCKDDDTKWHGSQCRWIGTITREARKNGVYVKAKCVRNAHLVGVEPQAGIGGATMFVLRVRSTAKNSVNRKEPS